MTGVVLLTGATGFVGRQVLHTLLERGQAVRAVVRRSKVAEMADQCSLESIVGTNDLFNETEQWWAETCANVDTVIHLAWSVEPGKYLDSAKNMHCLSGTLALAQGVAKAGVRRFIGIGTCFEYDLSHGDLSVDTPLNPLTVYAGSKTALYMVLRSWFEQSGIEFSWCRLFYLHGEGEDCRRLVPYIRNQLSAGQIAELGSGTQVRDFLDVCIAAGMIVDVALGGSKGAVNICSGYAVTVRELAEKIADEYGRRDLLDFGARADSPFDPPFVVGIP
ncbi:MAG: nucleoside-diphosphate-sugar epimerase [Halieaceae bacterium]|jgi:nucleoside-diphosphate-sugar epimerase